jgi:two-component system sensor histidine kinase RegB
VTGVHFGFGYKLPFTWCFLVIAASALLNLMLRIRYPASHRLSDNAATALLGFDILQLAAAALPHGGLQNPFSMLFLAPVLISATALPPERTLGLGGLAVGSASILVLQHQPLPWEGGRTLDLPFLYVSGVWAAIVLGAAFTGVYAWRVAEESRLLAQALAATELVLAREQHLSQLDGLAAAAAHELGTPLATIALVARSSTISCARPGGWATIVRRPDALARTGRACRGILAKLTSLDQDQSGFLQTITSGPDRGTGEAAARAREVEIAVALAGDGPEPSCRRNPGLLYGLANLIDNAVDFARGAGRGGGTLERGPGAPRIARRRAGICGRRAAARRRALCHAPAAPTGAGAREAGRGSGSGFSSPKP